MATAILFAAIIIGGAINKEWVVPDDGEYGKMATFFLFFIAYDVIKLLK